MIVSAMLLGALPISQSALADIARVEEEKLTACIEKVETAPEEAYEDSLAWLSSGNRPKARYCNAIALLALDRLEEGAARLEALANAPDPIELNDRIQYMAQAGNAWLAANYPEAAITALSEALKVEQDSPTLYKDRASAYLAIDRWMEGMDDLNAALVLSPTDPEALTLRARANLATENLMAAKADVEEAMIQDPTNIDILVLRGDIREAIRLKEGN